MQSGAGNWTISFKDSMAPKRNNGTDLNSSYTLKVELWAEGTYTIDPATGKAVALQAYNTKTKKWVDKSKPTIVKVKVTIK